MHSIRKISVCMGLLFMFIPFISSAQDQDRSAQELTAASQQKSDSFHGEINANHINIRSDSTVNSKIICIAHRGEPVEVVRESSAWYKIRLPKTAPSFIRKDLVALVDGKTAKVVKDNVNIRLNPDASSAILGKADKNEVINILGESKEWYKIEPLANSFGWVHQKFVEKVERISRPEPARAIKEENEITDKKTAAQEYLVLEGIIKPYGKVIKRLATHKLIAPDNKVFLLKGNKGSLDSLNYHKVRVTGKILQSKKQRYTVIEIQKIEALD